jgi:mRNA-degrading endonuclease HigB of HigAB toxin-antitoxin module
MEAGDQVKIVKKWLNSPAEAKLTFTVLEIIDNRVDIQVNGSTLRFVPIERVDLEHIEKI